MKHKIFVLLKNFQMQKPSFFLMIFLTLVFAEACSVFAQNPVSTPVKNSASKTSPERQFFKNILSDQKAIWTSPFRLDKADAKWLLPLGAATAGLIVTDRRTAGALDNDRSRINFSLNVGKLGSVYATGGAALAFYAAGKITGNRRAQETGLLAAEALINNVIVVEVLKLATRRARPLERDGHGVFFTHGSSFPSGHSAGAWTLAAILADEYGLRHSYIKYGAYGLAAAVSVSRYTARKHFLSDVLVGGAIGYATGHFIFKRHHDPDLDSPNGATKTTRLEKYFPIINPRYEKNGKIDGASLAWNF